MSTANTRAELEALRLPDLRARYIEVVGEDTRCPNKGWLIRKIEEALAARPATTASASAASEMSGGSPPDIETELRAVDDDWEEEASDTVLEEAGAAASTDSDASESATANSEGPDPALMALALERGRLSSLTVDELQIKYREIVGRSTGSTNRAYLVWKIKEAAKGRVPIGPRRGPPQPGTARVIKTIPLGFAPEVLQALDQAWRRRHLASRSDLFRRALARYLREVGEQEVAALLERGNAS